MSNFFHIGRLGSWPARIVEALGFNGQTQVSVVPEIVDADLALRTASLGQRQLGGSGLICRRHILEPISPSRVQVTDKSCWQSAGITYIEHMLHAETGVKRRVSLDYQVAANIVRSIESNVIFGTWYEDPTDFPGSFRIFVNRIYTNDICLQDDSAELPIDWPGFSLSMKNIMEKHRGNIEAGGSEREFIEELRICFHRYTNNRFHAQMWPGKFTIQHDVFQSFLRDNVSALLAHSIYPDGEPLSGIEREDGSHLRILKMNKLGILRMMIDEMVQNRAVIVRLNPLTAGISGHAVVAIGYRMNRNGEIASFTIQDSCPNEDGQLVYEMNLNTFWKSMSEVGVIRTADDFDQRYADLI